MNSIILKPDTPPVRAAEAYARSVSSPMLFNHVMRCYHFADLFAKKHQVAADQELLFLSAVLHDLGFTSSVPGQNRFEIEGAEAARQFLLEHGVSDERAWKVWHNIALHVGDLNLFKDDATRMLQYGILYDITGLPAGFELDAQAVDDVVQHYPRLGFKQGFLELFENELDRKQPYQHRFHMCACIEHHRTGQLNIPVPQAFFNSAPFAD
ncbi:HD domain-containing protein [Mucilaginibacter rubeus]|uniref:HD domain-containing protein n=1 Tax=Mucilaginibacter rubeus TaxID=2027860 RepID=A0AAE6JEG0_9SPHI|nr:MULTISPECIES: HD domain-containing protein [Mucilaginibacter]QEM04061.1 HD domain-containing protein [Mucilaginibacter rubeus]QEM16664.1 HD domain-containing protein [Mucilaginibacter gossypii]QTE46862.1 HD domain-containing protein [Mucilaginibacter rubeus]QTE53460.1 HD domain-containing protein [Mucilaginibacter rubeus]QTE58546.1 HD domain-containing protein [Mucilaginibacter rubeus]